MLELHCDILPVVNVLTWNLIKIKTRKNIRSQHSDFCHGKAVKIQMR